MTITARTVGMVGLFLLALALILLLGTHGLHTAPIVTHLHQTACGVGNEPPCIGAPVHI